VVAVLAHDLSTGTRGLQARGAKALGQAEHPLGAAQPIEGAIAEQRVDEGAAGGADLGGALAAPGRGLQEKVDFVRGQMRGERAPLPGAGAAVGGHERVLVEQLDLPGGGAHPQALANQAMRRRVVGGREHDVAVRVKLGLLPLGQLPRRGRQRREGGALRLVEDLERDPLGGAVDPAPRDLDAPAQHVAIGVVEVAERAPGQRVAFDVVDPALLDLPFVLGCPGPTGRDEEAVMLGALAVAPLDFGIVEGGADDRGAEIVEDDPMGHPAEEFERDPVESHPRVHRLVEHELGVLMPAARQCHHEDPGPADSAALGIQELAAEAEVHLRLCARVDLQAQVARTNGGVSRRRKRLTEE